MKRFCIIFILIYSSLSAYEVENLDEVIVGMLATPGGILPIEGEGGEFNTNASVQVYLMGMTPWRGVHAHAATFVPQLKIGQKYGLVGVRAGAAAYTNVGFNLPEGYIMLVDNVLCRHYAFLPGYHGGPMGQEVGVAAYVLRDRPWGKMRMGVPGSFGPSEVDWHVSLGQNENGESLGNLGIRDIGTGDDWSRLFTPEALVLGNTGEGAYFLKSYTWEQHINGLFSQIRQVVSREVIVYIEDRTENGYTLKFYNRNQTWGRYFTNFYGRLEDFYGFYPERDIYFSRGYASFPGYPNADTIIGDKLRYLDSNPNPIDFPSSPNTYFLGVNYNKRQGHPFVEYKIEGAQDGQYKELKITQTLRNTKQVNEIPLRPEAAVVRKRVTRLIRTGVAPNFHWRVEDWKDITDSENAASLVITDTQWTVDAENKTRTETSIMKRIETGDEINDGFIESTYKVIPSFGEAIVKKVTGRENGVDIMTTQWDYHSADPRTMYSDWITRWGKIKSIIHPDGRWEGYDYDDATKLVTKKYSPFLGTETNPPDLADMENIFPRINTNYVRYSHFRRDAHFNKVRSEESRFHTGSGQSTLIGKKEMSHSDDNRIAPYRETTNTYSGKDPHDFTTDQAFKAWKDQVQFTYNLRMLCNEKFATGKQVTHCSQWGTMDAGGNMIFHDRYTDFKINRYITITGQKNGDANNDPILIPGRSLKEIVDRDEYSRLVRTEQHVWDGANWQLLTWTAWEYNQANQIIRITNHKGQTQAYEYVGDMKVADEDGLGKRTEYEYDGLNRVIKETIIGYGGLSDLITEYEYNAMGLVLKKTIRSAAQNNDEALVYEWTYNSASQMTSYTEPGKGTIYYTYDVPSRKKTTTYPNGSTLIEEQYQDGKKKSITGTSVVHQYFDYEIDPVTGNITEILYLGQNQGSRWVKTTKNWKGDIVRVEKSGHTENGQQQPGLVETFYYNTTTGLLEKKSLTGMADTLYEYDCFGELTKEGLDVDCDGVLRDISNDEIVTYTRGYVQNEEGEWVYEEKKNIVLSPDYSARSYPVMVTRTHVGGISNSNRTLADAADLSSNATLVEKSYAKDGDNQEAFAETWYDSDDRCLATITYARGLDPTVQISHVGVPTKTIKKLGTQTLEYNTHYDSLWRPAISTDPRTGNTTTTYHSGTGLIYAITDPAQNRILENTYDQMGRLIQSKDVFNKITYTEYTDRGEVARVWGENTYPVSYEYDLYGAKIKMRTYRDDTNADWSSATWPSGAAEGDLTQWHYNPGSGLLERKEDAKGKQVSFTYNRGERVETKTLARNVKNKSYKLHLYYDYYDRTWEDEEPMTGRLKEVGSNDPNTTPIRYTYNRFGTLETVTDAATGIRSFAYDGNYPWRLIGEEFTDHHMSYHYEEAGENTVAGRVSGYTLSTDFDIGEKHDRYRYLSSGQLHSVTEIANDTEGRTFTYTYETNAPLLKSLNITGGNSSDTHITTTRTFEPHRNLITSVTASNTSTILAQHEYRYDSMGRRDRIRQSAEAYSGYGPGKSILRHLAYNSRSELIADQAMMETDINAPLNESGILPNRHYRYDYDAIGNRKSSARNGDNDIATYETNELNQYTQRQNAGTPLSGTTHADANIITYEDDDTSTATEPARQGTWWTSTLYNDPANDRGILKIVEIIAGLPAGENSSGHDLYRREQRLALLPPQTQNFRYDEDGNLIHDGIHHYTYDGYDRLISVTTDILLVHQGRIPDYRKSTYTYDYKGRRAQKEVTDANGTTITRYLYNGWHLIAEYHYEPATYTLMPLRTYTWGLDISSSLTGTGGIGALLQIHDHRTGQDYHPIYDAAGNITALHNPASNTLDAIYEYSPYGELIRATGPYAQQNPLRYSTKYHDDETNLIYYGLRYYSPDLGRFINRDPIEEKGGLNLYGFVGNNPINKWDILGMSYARWLDDDSFPDDDEMAGDDDSSDSTDDTASSSDSFKQPPVSDPKKPEEQTSVGTVTITETSVSTATTLNGDSGPDPNAQGARITGESPGDANSPTGSNGSAANVHANTANATASGTGTTVTTTSNVSVTYTPPSPLVTPTVVQDGTSFTHYSNVGISMSIGRVGGQWVVVSATVKFDASIVISESQSRTLDTPTSQMYGHEQKHILSRTERVRENVVEPLSMESAGPFERREDVEKRATELGNQYSKELETQLSIPDHRENPNPNEYTPGNGTPYDPLPGSPYPPTIDPPR